jgi:hypothetical protein
MDKELRIFKKEDVWSAELWCEHEEPFISGMYFEEKVVAFDFPTLLFKIGEKNWIDLLNK